MSLSRNKIEGILDVYTFEEILEYNDLSLQDTLDYLIEEDFIELPEYQPLEFNE